VINRFKRDVVDQPGIKWLSFSNDPSNDLGAGSGRRTRPQPIAGLQQLVTAAHATNLKYLCPTLTPFEGSGGCSADGEVTLGQVDAFIRRATSAATASLIKARLRTTATHDPRTSPSSRRPSTAVTRCTRTMRA
jgi:hypothetical protein